MKAFKVGLAIGGGLFVLVFSGGLGAIWWELARLARQQRGRSA